MIGSSRTVVVEKMTKERKSWQTTKRLPQISTKQ
jgi:hypothetical protein